MTVFNLGTMTLKSMVNKPETVLYPMVSKPLVAGLKGRIINNTEMCIVCGICAKKCPTSALSTDRAAHTWSINRFRCVQCGNCIEVCPKKCLSMDPHYTNPDLAKSVDTFEVPQK